MTRQELAALVRGLAPVLKDYVAFLHAKDRGLDGAVGPAGPEGKPGRDGQPGIPGRDGARGDRGADGSAGMNGKDGASGKDGRDGTLENLKVVKVNDRTWALCFKDGTPIEGGELKFDVPLYRGVYEAGKSYEKGDSVTFGNQQWIALEDTSDKPADGKAWRLAVRKGQDGREGKAGKDGSNGRDGKDAIGSGFRTQ